MRRIVLKSKDTHKEKLRTNIIFLIGNNRMEIVTVASPEGIPSDTRVILLILDGY